MATPEDYREWLGDSRHPENRVGGGHIESGIRRLERLDNAARAGESVSIEASVEQSIARRRGAPPEWF